MRLANELDEIHRLGAEAIAIVVDPPERNRAFAERWDLPFPIHSDPDGHVYLRQLDLWNPNERGGIALPALFLLAPNGTLAHEFRSRDFADRPTDGDLLGALAALQLSPVSAPLPWTFGVAPSEDPGTLRAETFGPYFRGIRYGTMALATRMSEAGDRDEARAMSEMAASFLDAWKIRRTQHEGRDLG